jgi:hypothetical protein
MSRLEIISVDRWYETERKADEVTLIHEPWIKPFYRCNMWHVRGRDCDLLFDSGLGVIPLRWTVALLAGRPIVRVAVIPAALTADSDVIPLSPLS